MNRKALILSIPVFLAILLLAGWFVLRNWNMPKESQNPPTVGDDPEEKVVWYEIPEIGIRFPTDQHTKNELIYSVKSHSNRLKEGAVAEFVVAYFSTRTLKSFSKDCSPENGGISSISRHFGEPYFPENPCLGGKMIKKISGGYFCVEKPQAPCMSSDEDERFVSNEKLLQEHRTSFSPFSDEFWESVEVFDLKK